MVKNQLKGRFLFSFTLMENFFGPKKFATDAGRKGSSMKYLIYLFGFFFRYVRVLGNLVHAIQIKTKLCQLVEVMMERRDDLSFCQEMKFR